MVNMANGTLTVPVVSIGETNTAAGSLNITGGTTVISSSLTVRSNSLASAGVSVFGGALYITNATHTATTIMNGGSLLLGAGVFDTDNFILANGGSVTALNNFLLGATAGVTNTLDLSSGSTLVLTNATLGLGNNGTTNGAGTGSQTFTLTINPPAPVVTNPGATSVSSGAAFSYQIVATNTPTSYSVTAAGLTLSVSGSGLVTGTLPAVTSPTNYSVTLNASNGAGTGSQTFTLTVRSEERRVGKECA